MDDVRLLSVKHFTFRLLHIKHVAITIIIYLPKVDSDNE